MAFPVLSIQTLEKNSLQLKKSETNYLLVNVWAVWCPPCRAEMPALQRLAQRVKGNNINIITLVVEKDSNLVKEFLIKYKIQLPVFLLNKYDAENYLGLVSYPLTFLVDKQGKILARLNGSFEWDNNEIYRQLIKLGATSGSDKIDISAIENTRLNAPVSEQ